MGPGTNIGAHAGNGGTVDITGGVAAGQVNHPPSPRRPPRPLRDLADRDKRHDHHEFAAGRAALVMDRLLPLLDLGPAS
jgi:hypothetical protein